MKKRIQKQIIKNLEPWFDNANLLSAVFSILMAFFIWKYHENTLETLAFLLSGISCAGVYFLRHKIIISHRAFIIIVNLFVLALIAFYLYGFTSSGFLYLSLALLIANIYLSTLLLIITITLTSLLIISFNFVIFSDYMNYDLEILNRINNTFDWKLESFIFLIITMLFAINFYAFRSLFSSLFAELEEEVKKTEARAYIDPLTKLLNRDGFLHAIEDKLTITSEGTFLLFDISDFKSINTLYGTDIGDEVLKTIGSVFQETKEPDTIIGRFGSNEFALYTSLTNIKEIEERFSIANQKVKSKLNIQHPLAWHVVYVNYPLHGKNFTTIYENATIAIKETKEKCPSDFIGFECIMRENFEKETDIKSQLKTALINQEFYSVFQKKINAVTNEVIGYEALSRWESKTLGPIPPSVFIKLLTKSNLMYEFSLQTIEKTMASFHNAKHIADDVKLSINISPTVVMSPDFTEIILDSIRKSSLSSSRLILEITEDVMVFDLVDLQKKVKKLKTYGIQFSLDDFGTGFSSLRYLTAIAFDEIKIDKAFIDNILSIPEDYELLKSIIALANVLNCSVVAEGVETKEQLEAVLNAGCHTIQGYYYAKPASLDLLNI